MGKARNFRELVSLVDKAEDKLIGRGVVDPGQRALMIRGIYYGTTWSKDFDAERSRIRNLGFRVFTGWQDPPDPRGALGTKLFDDLQKSQDVHDRGRSIDFGHLIIGLDARRTAAARVFKIPTQGGTGLEIVTWLGDLGGGAANLAWSRAGKPQDNVSRLFSTKGSDYGASINLEGDVAAYVIASTGTTLGPPVFGQKKRISEVLAAYLPVGRGTSKWAVRCRTFLQMIGGNVNGNLLQNINPLIQKLAIQIQNFAQAYMVQRYVLDAKASGSRITAACAHLEGAAREVAATFVILLLRNLPSPNRSIGHGRPIMKPSPQGTCKSAELEALAKAQDLTKVLYQNTWNAQKRSIEVLLKSIGEQ